MMNTIEFANIENAQIHYEVSGSGETVVFIHSGMTDSGMWDTQWETFTPHFRCVRFDRPGYGKSPKTENLRVNRRDLTDLLAQLDCEKVHLVGCSMGGEIVIDFALENPEKVLSLTLVASVVSGFQMQGEPPKELGEMIAALQSGNVAAATDVTNRMYVIGSQRTSDDVNLDVQSQIKAMTATIIQNGVIMQPDAAPMNPPAMDRLAEIEAPVLIVVGAVDHPEILRAADVIADTVPNGKKVIIENAAHFPNMEHPAKFNQTVLTFLQS